MIIRSFHKLSSLILALLVSTSAFGSAVAIKDDSHQLITIEAEMIFFGPSASEEVAQASAKEIETYWNGGTDQTPSSKYFSTLIDGKRYQVVFEISHQVVSEEQAQMMMAAKPLAKFNFIRILPGNAKSGDRSYMDKLGASTGVWYLSDNLGKSSTTAHEFGHGMGLDHPKEFDWRGRGQPAIMCPRGTIVDSDFQYSSTANPDKGEAGSTLDPYYRKVLQWDINNLHLGQRTYNSVGKSDLNQPESETPWRTVHTGTIE